MTIITNRVQKGVSTGGQFAPTAHHEPALSLAPGQTSGQTPTAFDYAFEKEHGKDLANKLQKLPKVSAAEAVAASRLPGLLRESYGEFYLLGEPETDRDDAIRQVESQLPNLSPARRAEHLQLMAFAVHTEMKHYSDPEYAAVAEHGYEVLINPDSYPDMDSDPSDANDDNTSKWGTLADTAAAHALAENAAAEHSAAA